MHPLPNLFRKAFVLGAAAATQALITGCVLASPANFSGHWTYKQACGLQHVATLDLEQAGDNVTGKWSDGTRVRGSEGSLKGELHDGTLYVRFCGIDEGSGYAVCPEFDSEITDHFVRHGSDLTWYQGSGKQFDRYLVLHPAVHGTASVEDGDCSRDAE